MQTSKIALVAASPAAQRHALQPLLQLDYHDAPPNVVRDLDNLMACAQKALDTLERMVHSQLEKPSVVSYLTRQQTTHIQPERPVRRRDYAAEIRPNPAPECQNAPREHHDPACVMANEEPLING
nr:MAG: protein B [Sichuan sediment noda-like virus 12]